MSKKRLWRKVSADGIGAFVILIILAVWLEESLRLSRLPGMSGPSMFPFLLSLFCLVNAGLWLANVLRSSKIIEFGRPKSLTVLVFAALVGYAIIVPYLGFVISTFLFLLATMAAFKKYVWWKLLLFGGISSFGFYLIFSKWLFIPFPRGLFD